MSGPSPLRRFRVNTVFTKEESVWIILKYGELKKIILV